MRLEAGSDFEDLAAQIHTDLESRTADKASILDFVDYIHDLLGLRRCRRDAEAVCQDLLSKLAESGVRNSELEEIVI